VTRDDGRTTAPLRPTGLLPDIARARLVPLATVA
jgi:hypothetical protein